MTLLKPKGAVVTSYSASVMRPALKSRARIEKGAARRRRLRVDLFDMRAQLLAERNRQFLQGGRRPARLR